MKINMNKDFEEAFQLTAWKGMTAQEVGTAAVAFGAAALVVFGVWKVTGIPVNISVYFGLPVMLPIAAAGIFKYQGSDLFHLVQEIRYMSKTKELAYEAGEYDQTNRRSFSMTKPKEGRKKNGSI